MIGSRQVGYITQRIEELLGKACPGRVFHALLYDVPGVLMDGVSLWTTISEGTEVAFNPKFLPTTLDDDLIHMVVGQALDQWPKEIPWSAAGDK